MPHVPLIVKQLHIQIAQDIDFKPSTEYRMQVVYITYDWSNGLYHNTRIGRTIN